MKSRYPWAVLILVAALCGCSKKPAPAQPASVPLVPEQERSQRFDRVNRELDLGGTLYGYVDVQGDTLKLAGMVKSMARQFAPIAPGMARAADLDYPAIVSALGLDDISAIGLSSVREGPGVFRDRAFFYTPQGRHGLLQALGGPPGPFVNARMAPADADLYGEADVDLPAAYAAIRKVVSQVEGPEFANGLDSQLRQGGSRAGWSILDLIEGLKGRVTVIGRIEPGKDYTLPGPNPAVVPHLSLVIGIEGIGRTIDRMLMQDKQLLSFYVAGRHTYDLQNAIPVGGMKAEIAIDGSTFYFATSPEFLDDCLARTSGLDQDPEFKRILATLESEGNSVSYVTPRFIEALHRVPEMNPQLPDPQRQALHAIFDQIPPTDHPLVSVRTNLPDGILVRAYYNRSFKRELMLPAIYNPLTLGLMAAVFTSQRNLATVQANQALMQAREAAPMASAPIPPAGPVGEDRRPRVLFETPALYPADLKARRVPGLVMVTATVDAGGGIRDAMVTMSPDPAFSAAAIDSVEKWRFSPGVRSGRYIPSRIEAPVVFWTGPAQSATRELGAVVRLYAALQTRWRTSLRTLGGRAAGRYVFSNPVWARIGLDDQGRPCVEDAGRGPDDPNGQALRRMIGQTLSEGDPAPLASYLTNVGHIDIAFPGLARRRPAEEAPPASQPEP